MTRKEEIREAAKIDYRAVEREAYWLAEQKFEDTFIQAVRYVRFVKFLASKNIITAPELTAPESSPAPLESQEELWDDLLDEVKSAQMISWTPKEYFIKRMKSKFILTRRTNK